MAKKTKKLNPRRIPIAKREINENAILEEATKDDLYHAWLLVFCALYELNLVPFDTFPDLTESVNQYIRIPAKNEEHHREDSKRAERLMGIPCPRIHMNIDQIRSSVELERFKQKVTKVATYTALGVLCLGLEYTGQFTSQDLRHIFLHADLTQAEIEHGVSTYKELENQLATWGMMIERESDDLHHAHLSES